MRAEVRGRDHDWRVLYANEASLATPFLVYDKDGLLKGTVMGGAPPTKETLTESHAVFGSADEACAYARWLGATEVTVRRTLTKAEALERARAARKETT